MTRAIAVIVILLWTVPAAAQAPHAWPLHLSLASSITAEAADLSVSMYSFGRGGFREANPVLRPLQDRPIQFAIAKMGTAAGASYLFVRIHDKHPRWAVALSIANTVLKSYIAVRNQRIIDRQN